MPRQIMLTLDGSTKDARALAVAAGVAELSGAPIELVRVLEGTLTGRGEAGRQLAAAADVLRAEVQRAVGWVVLEGDDVAQTLVSYASHSDALMLVMATRAPDATTVALRGSVADRVMGECTSPVLLVPPVADYLGGKQLTFSRVLVPLDGSALSARSLDYVLGLPRAAELEYALLEVARSEEERAAAHKRLDAHELRARAAGAQVVETDVGVCGDTVPVILAAVREALVDMIAMSSRGASGLRRLLLGSVAKDVVRACEVPVLLLTPACLGKPQP